LSKKDFELLFGRNTKPTLKKELSQPGQFACVEKVDIIGAKNEIKNVAILCPFREQTQVEISLTDARKLGIAAPIRDSGDLNVTPGCTLVGQNGALNLEQGVIIARRHIHLDPATAFKFNLEDGQLFKVRITSEFRSLIFDDVRVCINENFRPAVHVDTDEANAACAFGLCYGEIIK
jgi:putative phosphotransacetylase